MLTHQVFHPRWCETCRVIQQQFWMKECDILGGETYSYPSYIFSGVKTPSFPHDLCPWPRYWQIFFIVYLSWRHWMVQIKRDSVWKIVDFNRFQWPSVEMGCQPLRWIYWNAISSAGLGKVGACFQLWTTQRRQTERERERERERCSGGQAWELESTTVREIYLLSYESKPLPSVVDSNFVKQGPNLIISGRSIAKVYRFRSGFHVPHHLACVSAPAEKFFI